MTKHLFEMGALLGVGDFSEAYFETGRAQIFHWENGALEKSSDVEESGVGLRLIKGEETRFASTTLAAPFEKISASEAETMRRLSASLQGEWDRKPVGVGSFPDQKCHPMKEIPFDVSNDKKLALLEAADKAARVSPLIKQATLILGIRIKEIFYFNSEQEAFWEKRPQLVFNVRVAAEKNGDIQTGYESLGGVWGWENLTLSLVQEKARLAGERAVQKLSAPPAPGGSMPVILAAEAGGTLIHEAVGHSLEADAVLEGTSPAYANKIGERVANETLTVFDNPTLPGKRGSFYFDDEGVPAEPTAPIQKGVLKTLLYDRLSAKKNGVKPNGHGRRESFAHVPIPRMSNTYIAPGEEDPGEILSSVQNGFLVTRMGGGQVNTANGDFVFEVEEGFLLKDGAKQLVRGATLLGNGPKALADIDRLGNDHGWGIGTCGKEGQGAPVSDAIPTLRIKELVIGGTGG